MSSSLEKLVSVFDGSNYLTWSDSMRAWLRSQGFWQVVSGAELKPILLPQATAVQTTEIGARITAWENKNDQAFGSIVLRLAPSLRQHANTKTTAKQVWELLATDYGVDGPSQAFIDFRTAITIKIPANNPSPSISQMADKFQRLTAQNIAIPELVQAMVLLTAMPRDYDSLSSTVLLTTEASQLTFKLVRDHIVAEHNWRLAVGKPGAPQQANKLSTVKHKGANPKWQPKQTQQSEKSDDKKTDSAHHRRRAGKQVKERKEKAQEKCQQQHLHLASVAIKATPSAPAFTTVTGSGSIIPPTQSAIVNKQLKQRLTYAEVTADLRKCSAPQAFTGVTIGTPSVFEGYQEVRDTLAALDLAQSAQHLRPLEERIAIRDGKRRKINETASDTNIVEIQNNIAMGSDEIPYPISDEEIWNSVDDRLAEELDSMGPYIGGYDERSVLFSLTPKAPTKVKIPVRSSTNVASGHTYLHDPSMDKIKYCFHANNQCQRCISGNCKDSASWILDSGTSKHFSGELRDFASYQPLIQDETMVVQAASSAINIRGKGAVFISHHVKIQGRIQSRVT
jgi:hypothetical protein